MTGLNSMAQFFQAQTKSIAQAVANFDPYAPPESTYYDDAENIVDRHGNILYYKDVVYSAD